jgi:isopenicillin N synthase-like dioxygenase
MIPCFDLPDRDQEWTAETKQSAATEIGKYFRDPGFFFVRNHGIPLTLTEEAFGEINQFYRLPHEEKMRYDCSEESQYLGYRGLGREKSRTHSGAEPCEQYRIGNTDGPLGRGLTADFYHERFIQSRSLFHKLVELSNLIMDACAIDLELGEHYFDPYMDSAMHRLGLNLYKVGQARELSNEVTYAMSPHVDAALLTILTHDVLGLEVQDTGGEWTEVPVDSGAWFVFLGDYLQRWTNGLYRGAPHRVGAVTKERMSIQYKHRPSYGTIISPLEKLTSESNPPMYSSYDTGGEYLSVLRSILS